jgi:hypothetical protein
MFLLDEVDFMFGMVKIKEDTEFIYYKAFSITPTFEYEEFLMQIGAEI